MNQQTILQLVGQALLREKALIVGLLITGITLLATQLDIVIDDASLQVLLTPLVTGLITRFFVVPADEVEPVDKK